jgi:uncharacterized membrane protein
MTLMARIKAWLGIHPPEEAKCLRDEIRNEVHRSRNLAQAAVSEARRAEKVSNAAAFAAHEAINRLEAARAMREQSNASAPFQ